MAKPKLTSVQAQNRYNGEMRLRGAIAIDSLQREIRKEIRDLESHAGGLTIAGDLSSCADQEEVWRKIEERKKVLLERLERIPEIVSRQIREEILSKYDVDGEWVDGRFIDRRPAQK